MVLDSLVSTNRTAKLLALGYVGHREVQQTLGHPHGLGCRSPGPPVPQGGHRRRIIRHQGRVRDLDGDLRQAPRTIEALNGSTGDRGRRHGVDRPVQS